MRKATADTATLQLFPKPNPALIKRNRNIMARNRFFFLLWLNHGVPYKQMPLED